MALKDALKPLLNNEAVVPGVALVAGARSRIIVTELEGASDGRTAEIIA